MFKNLMGFLWIAGLILFFFLPAKVHFLLSFVGLGLYLGLTCFVFWFCNYLLNKHIPNQSYWGCKIGFHPWKHIDKNVDNNQFNIPVYCFAISARYKELQGEVHIRFCPCCNKIQKQTIDYSVCMSITDSPNYYWVDIKNKETNHVD